MTVDTKPTGRVPGRWGNRAMRMASAMHIQLYRRTGGRLGGAFPGGAPVLLLHTTGRKTGSKRTTPLLYIVDRDDLVVIASAGGAAKHPAWWLNLRAQPAATVQVGRDTIPVRAEEATGDEREHLWARAVDVYSGYAGYHKKTSRRIPVVVLRRTRAGHETTNARDA
ncbi:MAG: nitroreductase family deazaflavin-dependent oxidoreductase [Chloroflexia bacterium]|nr:nitroreductase family deazaflavin-dependent oxidoreductase [Chloroflexia bacterium]